MAGLTHRDREDSDRRFGVRRAEVLTTLRAAPDGASIRDLAELTGLHENTVRFHLTKLVQDGLVERRPRPGGGPGRPPMVYVPRAEHAPPSVENYELVARVLARGLSAGTDDVEEVARQYGVEWARSGRAAPLTFAESLRELDRFLHLAGFAPEVVVGDEEAEVRIHNCPFRAMAEEDRAVPCTVHLGIMQGVLDGSRSGGQVEQLDAFVTPQLCVARISTA